MLQIKNVATLDNQIIDVNIPNQQHLNQIIDAEGLTLFPGLIDPHVHFRTPGMQHKEDWITGARAAIHGGYTTVFDMPNTIPPTVSAELLREKVALIDSELQRAGIPLRYELYFGADKKHLSEIHRVKNDVVGVKVFMGCSTGNLVVDDDESLHAVFAIAARLGLLVAVHAEDEALIHQRKRELLPSKHYHTHSLVRDSEVATRAVEKAIYLARVYQAKLYVLHASTSDELNLIKRAKLEGLSVYAETTPHHLFLDDTAYTDLKGCAVVNPPLRSAQDREAVWHAVRDKVIDTIGSDHAPHLLNEKNKPYGECPSGMPGIETTLPLLITAAENGFISLNRIVELTSTRAQEIFNLHKTDDFVLVDMNTKRKVDVAKLKTKCAWSAFSGVELTGWPRYVFVNGVFITLE